MLFFAFAGRGDVARPNPLAKYNHIAQLLRSERERAGVTQAKLAEDLGVPQSAIAEIEAARRKVGLLEFVQWMEAIGADPRQAFQNMLSGPGKQ